MRTDWTISACCHVVVLGAALVSFSPARLPATQVESIPVNIVTDTTTSQVPRGQTNAKEAKNPFAEKIDTPSPVDNPNAKIAPKEVTASTDATPPPSPPEPKQEAAKKAEPQRDLIAEALKKDAAAKKAEQKAADAKKKADAKVPTPPKRPPTPQEQSKFDPREMQALLDKRDPQRKMAKGDTISDAPPLGIEKPRSTAAQLSQNELDALVARLAQLWNPPIGAKNPEEIVVTIRFRLKPDGTVDGYPMVLTSGRSALFMLSRERAANAIMQGQPFKMLRPENYEAWRDIEVTFDPKLMIRE
ncbi:MAG: cell envelope biogenesis protein TolA [Xanthobacteraceae bacterium]|nr:cell envelope biogenesis protein TolA [Xanthobacteraceae bacterium]